jgi:hypothetical protein
MKFVGLAMVVVGMVLFATVGYGTETTSFTGSGMNSSIDLHWGKIIAFGSLLVVGGILAKVSKTHR